jgi:hypothetical protein
VAVSFIDEGNRSTPRNPTTCKLNYHNMAKTMMAPVVNPGINNLGNRIVCNRGYHNHKDTQM